LNYHFAIGAFKNMFPNGTGGNSSPAPSGGSPRCLRGKSALPSGEVRVAEGNSRNEVNEEKLKEKGLKICY
jgi:hypothetical protein